jgi:tRNA(Ile)-lysidine synthase TilS/MesJ
MIIPGERVCVALSGGKDSTTLLYILWYLNRYSHLHFDLSALHIKTGVYDTSMMQQLCAALNIPYYEEPLNAPGPAPRKSVCSLCSRLKRGAMSAVLKNKGIRKIAFAHHANDIAETFFMNILQNKKLGSFSPRVEYDNNPMVVIRPLMYLEESTISRLHKFVGLEALEYQCPYAGGNIRRETKNAVMELDAVFGIRGFARRLVESLENVDKSNLWENVSRHQSARSKSGLQGRRWQKRD